MEQQTGENKQNRTAAGGVSESAVEQLVMAYPAISIRQPWAWMILNAGKDIENRTWRTRFRGKVLIHAAKGMKAAEWNEAWGFARTAITPEFLSGAKVAATSLQPNNIERGGIIGIADIVDCVSCSDSSWFVGPHGFVLHNVEPLPFFRWWLPCLRRPCY